MFLFGCLESRTKYIFKKVIQCSCMWCFLIHNKYQLKLPGTGERMVPPHLGVGVRTSNSRVVLLSQKHHNKTQVKPLDLLFSDYMISLHITKHFINQAFAMQNSF